MKKIIVLCVSFLIFLPFDNIFTCDMITLIAKPGKNLNFINAAPSKTDLDKFNDPMDFFNLLKSYSRPTLNNDGYGVVAYRKGLLGMADADLWYLEDKYQYYKHGFQEWKVPFDKAVNEITDKYLDNTNDITIILAHTLNRTIALKPLPTRFYDPDSGKTYTFMSDGNGLSESYVNREKLFNFLNQYKIDGVTPWFEKYPSGWKDVTPAVGWQKFPTGDISLHYIMYTILILSDGNVKEGLHLALNNENFVGAGGEIINIHTHMANPIYVFNAVFSDGENVYVIRTSKNEPGQETYEYGYFETDDYYALTTVGLGDDDFLKYGFKPFKRLDMAIFSPYAEFDPAKDIYSDFIIPLPTE